MSYAHNKRKKNRTNLINKVCISFNEFCAQRKQPLPITMTKEQYDNEMGLWLNYKRFYNLELTLREEAWLSSHTNKVREVEGDDE